MEPEREIEHIEVDLVLEAIHAKYGCDLRGYARASLQRRMMVALARSELAHLGELQHKLLRDPVFFAQVLTDLTVQVTELFRDPPFYRAFGTHVVPLLRTYPLLRIWHAGCATGEEAYSTAIVLSEAGLYERTQIYATDLSAHAVDRAKQGVYDVQQLARYATNYQEAGGTGCLSNYFTEAYGHAVAKEALRRNILFFQHNLASDHAFGEMHVVFCRNVLIYLGAELRATALLRIARSLCPGGFLCLGSSERPVGVPPALFQEFMGEHHIYRYTGAAG